MTDSTRALDGPEYDARRDSFMSWELAINAIREKLVRSAEYPPDPDKPHEQQWAEQGVVPVREMACVRRANG